MSLDLKEVIKIARAQFEELLPELRFQTTDVRLEEIEREGDNWAITLSVPNPNGGSSLISGLMALGRVAKVVVVDGRDGKLIALRQRAA
jgi:hypothetical protein